VVSPGAKRGDVSHRHTTIVNLPRTLHEIFGRPPLNMFAAQANDLFGLFHHQAGRSPLPVPAGGSPHLRLGRGG